MTQLLKQSTAATVMLGAFVDATDGVTEEVGLAGGGTEISKAGAAFGTGPVLGTHDAEGWYPIDLTTTHTNTLGPLVVKSHNSATHLPVWKEFSVLSAVAYARQVEGVEYNDRGGRIWFIDGATGGTGTRNSPFTTFTAAQSAASFGDTLYFLAGTYAGAIEVTKAGLTLQGDGEATVITHNTANTLTVSANDVSVRLMKITTTDATNGTAIYGTNGARNSRYEDLHLIGKFDGIRIDNAHNAIMRRIYSSSAFDAIAVVDGGNVLIENCTALTDGTHGSTIEVRAIHIAGGTGVVIRNTQAIATRTISTTAGTGTLGIGITNAGITLEGVYAEAKGAHASVAGRVAGIGYEFGTGPLICTVIGCQFASSQLLGGSGATYDIDANVSGSLVTILGSDYSTSKVNGAANVRAVHNALTPLVAGRQLGVESDGDLTKVNTLDGHTPQTGDTFALADGTSGFANIKTDTAAILVDTNELQTDWLDGGRLDLILDSRASQSSIDAIDGNVDTLITNVPDVLSLAAINAEVDAALAEYDAPTKTELDAAVAAVSVSEIQVSALADLFDTDSGTTYSAALAGSVVKEIADNAGGGVPPTAPEIADAVWEEQLSDHSGTSGSTAEQLSAAGSAGDPWATTLPGSYTGSQAGKLVGDNTPQTEDHTDNIAAIMEDSNELQTDWANGGRLDLLLDNTVAKLSQLVLLSNTITATVSPTEYQLNSQWSASGIKTIDIVGCIVLIEDVSDSNRPCLRRVVSIEDDSQTLTLTINAAANFTVTAGDRITILVIPPQLVGHIAQTANHTASIAAIMEDSNELQTDLTVDGRLDVVFDVLVTKATAIEIATNELQTDWEDGGRLDENLDVVNNQLLSTLEGLNVIIASGTTIQELIGTPVTDLAADIAAIESGGASILQTTVGTVLSQTSIILSAGSGVSNYVGCALVIRDADNLAHFIKAEILSSTGNPPTLGFYTDQAGFTIASGDSVEIFLPELSTSDRLSLGSIEAYTADMQPKLGTPVVDLATDISQISGGSVDFQEVLDTIAFWGQKFMVLSTTINDSSSTQVQLMFGSTTDGYYDGMLVIIRSAIEPFPPIYRYIKDYVGQYYSFSYDEPIAEEWIPVSGDHVEIYAIGNPSIVSVGGKSGGGTLQAKIGEASLAPSKFLEIIQGEEKIITFVVEADGRFDLASAGSISVKLADPFGNVVTKTNANIDRVAEELDVQVFRTTLSPLETATLRGGLLRIEIAFDDQKARLTHALKMVAAL
jgi:hypothetical protein